MEEIDAELEERLGLSAPDMQDIRRRDQLRTGRQGHNKCGGFSHQQGLYRMERAVAVFNALPDAAKTTPGDTDLALGIAQIAQYARVNIPTGCMTALANHTPPIDAPEKHQDYIAIGGIICRTKKDAHNFMKFVDINMHDDYRAAWGDLTGREQHEWWKAWQAAGTPTVAIPATTGLRGTDLSALTAEELRPLARIYPTLGQRRPADHAVPADQWPRVRRRIF